MSTWTAQTHAALRQSSYAMLSVSVGQIVQHALSLGTDTAKAELVSLLVDDCCGDPLMPAGVLVSVLAPVIDTLVFLLADPAIPVLKRTVRAATSFYRTAYKTIATIPLIEVATWIKLCQLKTACKTFFNHPNIGLRSNAIKFYQTIVLVHSHLPMNSEPGDVSLELIQPNHPYLFPKDLQRESVEAFTALIATLNENCPGAIVTATISALFPIIKTRPVYSATAVQSLIQWIRTPPPHLSQLQIKNVQRSIRNEFLAILSTKLPEVSQFVPVITEILVGMGVKGYEISTRVKARDQGAKRVLLDEDVPAGQPAAAPMAAFDVQSVPINLAVDLVIQVMNMTPPNLWIERLAQFGQTLLVQEQQQQQQLLAEAAKKRDPRMMKNEPEDSVAGPSTTPAPPLATPQNPLDLLSQLQTLHQIKSEPTADSTIFQHQQPTAPVPQQPQLPAATTVEPAFDPTLIPLPEMSPEDKRATWKHAFTRILDLEPYFSTTNPAAAESNTTAVGVSVNPLESVTAARTGWMLLLVRLLTVGNGIVDVEWKEQVAEMRQELEQFVVDGFKVRYELAVLWLHEEYHLGLMEEMKNKKKVVVKVDAEGDEAMQEGGDGEEVKPFKVYEELFHLFLHALKGPARVEGKEEGVKGLDPKDRMFTKFLIDVPVLTTDAVEGVVKSYCEDPERMLLGFSTLRDLILLRPAVRDSCLHILLAYCIHTDKIIRSNAILLARRWISPDHPVLGPLVEKYATDTLLKLCGPPEEEDEEEEGGSGVAWEEIDAIRHFELYFALSSKKHSLLSTVFTSFDKFMPEVATTILQQIDPLIRSMASAVTVICGILLTFPKGAEPLVRKVVDILTEREPVNPEIVVTVVELVEEHGLDGTWILRVVSGLNRQQVLHFLPKLISLLDGSEARERLVETGLFKVIASDQDLIPSVVIVPKAPAELEKKANPAEILIAIHNMEGTVDLKLCLEGTKLCIKHPEVYKQEVLAIVIQQLVDQQKIPTLFMRTVLESVKLYPTLATFINGILTRLISKRVWVNTNLWKGFVICCKLTAPTSFGVIITLPKPQLEDILNKEPGLKPGLYEYCLGLPTAMRSRVKGLLPMLEDPHSVQLQQQQQQQFQYA
ncbi:hypothetical protein HDU98_010584 [Podochytrium sp. JEL0797]|nr:hypothetical protein HDU98_010584 [Podochytrium sp. JEL0797]